MKESVLIRALADVLAAPLGLLADPAEPFWWPYLLASFALGLAAAAIASGLRGPTALRAGLRRLFDPAVYRHPSAKADYIYVYLNQLIGMAEGPLGIAAVGAVAALGAQALTALLGAMPQTEPSLAVKVGATFIALVVFDFFNFFFHLAQHRSPVLWEFHKVHHSAEVLTPVTNLRVHPLIMLVKVKTYALFMGVPSAFFLYHYPGHETELTILGVNAGLFLCFALLGGHLAHTHVPLIYPRALRAIFYSPALHLVHHSADPAHYDRNLGLIFSVWDRLWGTLHEPTRAECEALRFGLEPDEMPAFRTVGQLYWTPLRNLRDMAARARWRRRSALTERW